jgi:APA family basic amino acid/polyamine antiporter
VTGIAAGVAGPALIVSLLVAAVAATCNALSSAELAVHYPQSGGTYEYGYRLVHPWAGFCAGWMFLVSKLAAGGTVALGFGNYLARIAPALPPRASAVAATVLLTLVNLAGIRKAGKLNLAIVTATLLALTAFVVAGVPHVALENFRPFAPGGVGSVLEGAALLFFAFTGYARLATLGEEVRDPERTIPRAIVATIVIAVALYVAVAVVAVGVVGADALAATTSPLHAAADATSSSISPWAVAIGAVTAMLGVLLSQILGISRMMLSMARRGDLPASLERVSTRHAVPGAGIVASGVIIATLALVGTVGAITATASFAILLYYTIANIAALRLAPERKRYPRFVAYLGIASCLALAASLPPATMATGAGLLALGFLVRALLQRSAPAAHA